VFILINNIPVQWLPTVGRLWLVVPIALLLVLERFRPSDSRFLRLGNTKETLCVPLIWQGIREPVWRFTLIFCGLWLVVSAVFWPNGVPADFLLYGLVFSAVNSILEEILWRGLLLSRAVDWLGEIYGLILSSLAFGFYHLTLGFSVLTCLFFTVGGFYLGGAAIRSKGLLAPIIMHFFVNMAFVSLDMIF